MSFFNKSPFHVLSIRLPQPSEGSVSCPGSDLLPLRFRAVSAVNAQTCLNGSDLLPYKLINSPCHSCSPDIGKGAVLTPGALPAKAPRPPEEAGPPHRTRSLRYWRP